jgi:hypothetical protein
VRGSTIRANATFGAIIGANESGTSPDATGGTIENLTIIDCDMWFNLSSEAAGIGTGYTNR